jgi:Leucine-rich repeat (LRR) protein
MKYIVGIVILVLVTGGIFLGFNLGKNNKDSKTTTPSSSSETNTSTTAKSSSSAVVLDLSNKGITKVTPDIYNQTATTDLILSNNSIQTLPSQMGKMTNVVIFKIDHNVLEGSLIGEIRQMSKLINLDVSYNNMTGMPAEIGQLSNLQTLNYSYNKIDGLPNELGNLKNNLKEFNLTGNPLSQDTINKLKSQLPTTNIIF